MKTRVPHVVAGLGIVAALGLAYLAAHNTGPVPQGKYSEDAAGPLMEHMISEAEQIVAPVLTQQRYPSRVAPSISNVIQKGYSPLYAIPDPQAAALPAEQAW